MSAHTPGGYSFIKPGGEPARECFCIPRDWWDANRSVLEAAPALLEALEQTLGFMLDMETPPTYLIERARAAIQAARGQE